MPTNAKPQRWRQPALGLIHVIQTLRARTMTYLNEASACWQESYAYLNAVKMACLRQMLIQPTAVLRELHGHMVELEKRMARDAKALAKRGGQ